MNEINLEMVRRCILQNNLIFKLDRIDVDMGRSREEEDALNIISASVNTLAYYARTRFDAQLMEDILNNIFKRRFEELNRPGEEPRYTVVGKGSVGSVWLGRANNPDVHCMDICFCPSERLQEEAHYLQRVIGIINLAEGTYGLSYRDACEPEEIFSHTDRVMADWGLKKGKFKRSPQD